MKLNLGCGDDIREGYVNVDFRQTHPSVVIADLSKFPWPFEDESADEILMLDFLEHFPYAQTRSILLQCFRVLKPTGSVVIQVPDAYHLAMALTGEGPFLCNRCGASMCDQESSKLVGEFMPHASCPDCGQSHRDISDAAMRRLYGGQDYPGNFHHTCFTQEQLTRQAQAAGLGEPQFEERDHQYKNWNFKVRLKRVDLW